MLAPNANTGSVIYRGHALHGLGGEVVFTDWISFARNPRQGLLMHAPIEREHLQEVQPIHLFDVDLSAVGLRPGDVLFYTSINTDERGDRIFVGGFKDIQFIVNQRENPPGGSGLAGGLYEVIPD